MSLPPAGGSGDTGDKNNSKSVGTPQTPYNQTVNEPPAHFQNNNTYMYHHGMNGAGSNVDGSQWSAFGKRDDVQYQGGMGHHINYDQDEANFVQSFVQQPFLSYPYLAGYQQPFANQPYTQFGYPFGQPYSDMQQYMGLEHPQAFFGPDGYGGNSVGEADGLAVGGADLLNQAHLFPQLYHAMANLSLQDVQSHQLLQQQLYHQHLFQLQQQQQQLQQQLLQTSQQLALHTEQMGLEGKTVQEQQQYLQSETQDKSEPTSTIDNKKEEQQEHPQKLELPQEVPPITSTQDTHQSTPTPTPTPTSTVTPTPATSDTGPAPTPSPAPISTPNPIPAPVLTTATPQDAQATPIAQKPKQEGPRSWADIASKQVSASTVSSPTPTSTSSDTHDITTATTQTTSSAPLPPTDVPHNNVTQTSGAVVPVKSKAMAAPKHAQKINPTHFDYNVAFARFFVIKSYSEDDIHKSIKYNVWASTDSGNRRLDAAYKESATRGPIYLFFSVNASGQFCGMARMTSALDYTTKCELWAQDKWNGQFSVSWIFIKDIPNAHMRHIRLINNENKPVTNSRDTQEIFLEPGREVLRIFSTFTSKTSILDDFTFYDQRQEQMKKGKLEDADEYNDAQGGELLPVATGEGRKQRGPLYLTNSANTGSTPGKTTTNNNNNNTHTSKPVNGTTKAGSQQYHGKR